MYYSQFHYRKIVKSALGEINMITNNDVISDSLLKYSQEKWQKMLIDHSIADIKDRGKNLYGLQKKIDGLSIEDAKSLLFVELTMSGNFSQLIRHNDNDFKNLLRFCVFNYQNPISRFNELVTVKLHTIMPEAYLNWFKNDLRISLYLLELIEDSLKKERITLKGSDELLTYLRDYLSIDTLGFMKTTNGIMDMKHKLHLGDHKAWNYNQAISFLIGMKDFYLNNKVKDKEIRWIDSSNKEQVQYLCERMEDQKILILAQNFFPNNTKEMYSLLLASLDKLKNYVDLESEEYKNLSERDFVLYLLKRAWKAKDDRKEKSESGIGGIKIYQKNEAKLKNLICKHGVTPNKLLNKLVEDEYDKICN